LHNGRLTARVGVGKGVSENFAGHERGGHAAIALADLQVSPAGHRDPVDGRVVAVITIKQIHILHTGVELTVLEIDTVGAIDIGVDMSLIGVDGGAVFHPGRPRCQGIGDRQCDRDGSAGAGRQIAHGIGALAASQPVCRIACPACRAGGGIEAGVYRGGVREDDACGRNVAHITVDQRVTHILTNGCLGKYAGLVNFQVRRDEGAAPGAFDEGGVADAIGDEQIQLVGAQLEV